ncbi:hypothetical protein C8J57DRAFT_1212266 [Mycena rebaudengoi]|nr:hypothetical protein C8J57DRAFT_1212266 [Mycena rebaudengoi]
MLEAADAFCAWPEKETHNGHILTWLTGGALALDEGFSNLPEFRYLVQPLLSYGLHKFSTEMCEKTFTYPPLADARGGRASVPDVAIRDGRKAIFPVTAQKYTLQLKSSSVHSTHAMAWLAWPEKSQAKPSTRLDV